MHKFDFGYEKTHIFKKGYVHDPKFFGMIIYRYSSHADCLNNFLLTYKLNFDQLMA